jgi:hypothetical protein
LVEIENEYTRGKNGPKTRTVQRLRSSFQSDSR